MEEYQDPNPNLNLNPNWRNAIHEEYQGKIEVIRKENSALREQTNSFRKAKSKIEAELSQTKAQLRGYNDLVMTSKLREVEIEKVKEFTELSTQLD